MHLLFLLLLLAVQLSAGVVFEPNRGQAPADVEFFTRQGRGFVAFSGDTIRFVQPDAQDAMRQLSLRLVGAADGSRWRGQGVTGATTTYRNGTQPILDVPHYQRIERKDVYPGIDLVFYFEGKKLEYDFVVHPGADLKRIRLQSSEALRVEAATLAVAFASGEWRQKALVIYQETPGGRRVVDGSVVRCGVNEYCFEASGYERGRDLVLDPVLEFSSYLGGDGEDELQVMGSSIIAGSTTSTAFLNASIGSRRQRDIFVRLADPKVLLLPMSYDGSTVILGGSGDDSLAGFHFAAGPFSSSSAATMLVLCGTTSSRDLIPGVPVRPYGGGETDGFLIQVRLQPLYPSAGFSVTQITGTYLGGSGADRIHGMRVSQSAMHLVGETSSTDLPVVNAIQSSSGGKVDGLFASYSTVEPFVPLYLSYWGGSGDDRFTAVASAAEPGVLYVGGETDSPDFPGFAHAPEGPSDAFVLVFRPLRTVLATRVYEPQYVGMARIGGDGMDRITSLASTNALYIAGVTTSTNLPVREAFQPLPGGGEDGFLGVMPHGQFEPSILTYVGGSGDDRILRVVGDGLGLIGFGGTTTSHDLKTHAPLQSTNAGGMDGMFGTLVQPFELTQLSYFGGSGDDQVRAVQLFSSGQLRIAGTTGSRDLPLVRPVQGVAAAQDSFVADVGGDFIDVTPELFLAKGYNATATVRFSRAVRSAGMTVKIADASIASLQAGTPLSEMTVNPTLIGSETATVRFYGLVEEGETTVTFEVPGLGRRTMRLVVGKTGFEFDTNLTLYAHSRMVSLNVRQVVQDPRDPSLRRWVSLGWAADMPAPMMRFQIQDPSVVSLNQDSRAINADVTALRIGSTEINVTSNLPLFSPSTFTLTVRPADFVRPTAPMYTYRGQTRLIPMILPGGGDGYWSSLGGKLRAESGDPELLEVGFSTVSNQAAFGASSEYDSTGRSYVIVYLLMRAKALHGDTIVRISGGPLAEDVVIPIAVRPVVARFRVASVPAGMAPILPVQTSFNLTADFVIEGTSVAAFPPTRGRVEVASSNAAAVSAASFPSVDFSTQLRLSAAAEGRARLSFTFEETSPVRAEELEVEVSRQAPLYSTVPRVQVGKDLITTVQVPISFVSAEAAQITVLEPEKARLVAVVDGRVTGVPVDRLSDQKVVNGSYFTFAVVGEASEGTTKVRIEVAGRIPVEVPVELRPSGFAFAMPFQARPLQGFNGLPIQVTSYVLDSTTLAPIVAQGLRPGRVARVVVTASPEGMSPETISCQAGVNVAGLCLLQMSFQKPGRYRLKIGAVEGFATAGYLNELEMEVRPMLASLASNRAVRDGVVAAQLSLDPTANAVAVTVRSLDPGRLLLSTDRTVAGQESVSVRRGQIVYLHGLADAGSSEVELSGADLETSKMTIFHSRMVVGLSSGSAPDPVPPATILRGAVHQFSLRLTDEGGALVVDALRPGTQAIPVRVENSNPRAIQVALSRPEFGMLSTSIEVSVSAVADGEAEYSILPAGFGRVGPYRTKSRVAGLRLTPTLVSKHQASRMRVVVETGGVGPADNSLLTIRSVDPSRLLVARTTGTTPVASITIPWGIQQPTSDEFYLFAQDTSGQVDLELSMAGYDTRTSPVYLTGSYLDFESRGAQNRYVVTTGDTVSTGLRLVLSLRPEVTSLPGFQFSHAASSVTPAMAFPLRVLNSDAEVLEVAEVSSLWAAGGRLQLRGLKPGLTVLRIEPPAELDAPPVSFNRDFPVNVEDLALPVPAIASVGYQQVQQIALTGQIRRDILLTSQDPGRLLLSRSLEPPASASIVVPASTLNWSLYLHAVGGAGKVDVLATAVNGVPAKMEVTIHPSAFALQLGGTASVPFDLRVNTPTHYEVRFVAVRPDGVRSLGTLRPGAAPVTVQLRSTDPDVVRVAPATLVFQPGENTKTLLIEALKPGTAKLEVLQPAGFATIDGATERTIRAVP